MPGTPEFIEEVRIEWEEYLTADDQPERHSYREDEIPPNVIVPAYARRVVKRRLIDNPGARDESRRVSWD